MNDKCLCLCLCLLGCLMAVRYFDRVSICKHARVVLFTWSPRRNTCLNWTGTHHSITCVVSCPCFRPDSAVLLGHHLSLFDTVSLKAATVFSNHLPWVCCCPCCMSDPRGPIRAQSGADLLHSRNLQEPNVSNPRSPYCCLLCRSNGTGPFSASWTESFSSFGLMHEQKLA